MFVLGFCLFLLSLLLVTFNNYTFGNIIGNFQTLDGEKLLNSTEISHFSRIGGHNFLTSYLDPLRRFNFGQLWICSSPEPLL